MSWAVVSLTALGYKFEKPQKGIDPMTNAPPETIKVSKKEVACNGGDGALGHPRVYLNLGSQGRVVCPYCDRLFILEGAPPAQKAKQ